MADSSMPLAKRRLKMLALATGEIINQRYRLDKLLGEGGIGKVFLAHDLQLERKCAIKILSNTGGQLIHDRQRFEQEAQALNQLTHRYIVGVYHFGFLSDETPFLVMEYVEGETLRQFMQRKKYLRCSEAIELALQICAALDYAHSRGVVHRDIKPENISVKESAAGVDVKILDFGLCKLTEFEKDQKTLTETGFLLGTALYMSPEQCVGKKVDQRTDIYSFACVLFEMLAGRAAFADDALGTVLLRHSTETIPPLSRLAPFAGFPKELDRLISRAGQINREERFQSCAELMTALEQVASLNSSARFDQISQKGYLVQLINAVQAPVLSKSLLVSLSILSFMILAFLSYFFLLSDNGRIMLCQIALETLPIEQSRPFVLDRLNSILKSGDERLARELVAKTVGNSSYESNGLSRSAQLLPSYIECFRKQGLGAQVLELRLKLLSLEINLWKKQEHERVGHEPQVAADLSSLSRELATEAHSKTEWGQISQAIEKNIGASRANFAGLWFSILRCESRRQKAASKSDDEWGEILKLYSVAIAESCAANDTQLTDQLLCEFFKTEDEQHIYDREFAVRMTLCASLIRTKQIERARAELALMESKFKDFAQSEADGAELRRLRASCAAGRSISIADEAEGVKNDRFSIRSFLPISAKSQE